MPAGCEEISGAIAWSMNDYNTHETLAVVMGSVIMASGYVPYPKLAAYTYMAEYSKTPFIEVSTNFDIGEYDSSLLIQFMFLPIVIMLKSSVMARVSEIYLTGRVPEYEHPPIMIPDLFGNAR